MSMQAVQAGIINVWGHVCAAASSVCANVAEFGATYVPVVKTNTAALATFINSGITAPVIAKSAATLAPLGVAGPFVWLIPTIGAAAASLKVQGLAEELIKDEDNVKKVALRVAGFALALAAGASAAIFVGSFVGVATTAGVVATYGTLTAVTIALLCCFNN